MKKFMFINLAIVLSFALVAFSEVKTSKSKNISTESLAAMDAMDAMNAMGHHPGYQPDLWPQRPLSPPREATIEQRAADILAKLSVEEKVGQIIQPELTSVTPADIKRYHIGSILNGGDSRPNDNKFATVQDWANLADKFYQASMDESDGHVAIPLIWGSDAVHGNNNIVGATVFPHNIGLGAAGDPELIYRIGRVTAMEVVPTGVDWTFGPTVAVVRDVRWGRTYESYSEAPNIVMDYAREMVRGIQGDGSAPGVYKPENLIATAKHFIGDGGTTQGIDQGDTAVSERDLVNIHAAGYIAALDADVLTTMASFNSWNGEKLHGHQYLMTDILKGRLGFDGLVVSDWNGHRQVPGCSVQQCATAINAGIDLVMVPNDWKEMLANTLQAVKEGEIPMSRLNDAVTRILRVKLRAGLFEAGSVLARPYVGDVTLIGHANHRAVAREAVRKSLVLLKNNGGILPLSPKANILVAGDGADNIGKQAGGWTLSWQGAGNSNQDFPGATSLYDGIKASAEAAGGTALLSPDGTWDEHSFKNGQKPDVAVVVYGEDPYAEFRGDLVSIEYQSDNKQDLNLLKHLKAQDIPVVSVFITGRPLWVNPELNASDAFVVVWLPGSEGNGVADVMMQTAKGDVNYDFQGKLSFSWPKTVEQAALNVGQEDYDPLFPYGYGLTYAAPAEVANDLDESTVRRATEKLEEAWLFVTRAVSEYEFYLTDEGAQSVVVPWYGGRQVSSPDENLLLLPVDKVAQADALRFMWKGTRPATLSLTAKRPVDFSQYMDQNSVLSFDLKVDQAPAGQVSLSMVCGDDCGQTVSLTESFKRATVGEYVRYQFDLGCFAHSGAEMNSVTEAFVITSTAALDVSVANIKVVPNVADGDVVRCTQ